MSNVEEIRAAREATSIFRGLFDYLRDQDRQLASEGRRPVLGGLLSKEPVMGTDTIRYEGLLPMLASLAEPLARGIDAPRAAAQQLIPAEDMMGEAFGTAGTAMFGGGAVPVPGGAVRANSLGADILSLQAKSDPRLAKVLVDKGVDPDNADRAPFSIIQEALDTASRQDVIDPRSANAMLSHFAPNPELSDFYANSSGIGGLLSMQLDTEKEMQDYLQSRGLLQ